MARMTRKELLKRDEVQEAAVDVGHWIERNWQVVAKWSAAVAVVALIIGAVAWYLGQQRAQAAADLGSGLQIFAEAVEGGYIDPLKLEEALGKFEEARTRAGGSATGKIASYYQAATLDRLDRSDEALPLLEPLYSANKLPSTLQGSASALYARLLLESGETERAIEVLEQLSEAGLTGFPREQALLQLGHAFREAGRIEQAREVWETVVDEFPTTPASQEARQLLES